LSYGHHPMLHTLLSTAAAVKLVPLPKSSSANCIERM